MLFAPDLQNRLHDLPRLQTARLPLLLSPVFPPPLLFPRRTAAPTPARPETQPLGGGQEECSFVPGGGLGRVA